jgi:hypothetical protein
VKGRLARRCGVGQMNAVACETCAGRLLLLRRSGRHTQQSRASPAPLLILNTASATYNPHPRGLTAPPAGAPP